MSWFSEHKDALQLKHPNITASELTKLAMREYKSVIASGTMNGVATTNSLQHKRKMTDDEVDPRATGVSKLAKFGFSKS